ncbi:ester cyclase [Thalassotalea sp. PS06]|uniref:nuclear transport factor 2 family protein n=1 Tax=Thalassotalea sp. PS06 TaxID=2594005 RepID=UPI001164E41D|nr:ester cyclase [Thalassotalea sp. PS06]QDP00999.1 ester cyclase [Thalassotalea sp. PS06]
MSQQKVTQLYWKNLPELLSPEGNKVQTLKGFDPEFIDIVDYIIRITHRIWEQKNIGLCVDYYGEYCPVHTLGGYSDDVETVVKNTLKTIGAFPDRSLIGENVIWRDLGEEYGYYSSHRITSIMTNKGPSEFGPATGKTGRVTTIADCICYENKIVYEWLMRDNSFLVKQLGLDVLEAAHHFAQLPDNATFEQWRQNEIKRVKAGEPSEHQWPTKIADNALAIANRWIDQLFNQKSFSHAAELYHLNAKVQWPGGVEAVGIPGIKGVLIRFLSQVPDARATVDHVGVTDFEDKGEDIAIRWSIAGTFHSGDSKLSKFNGQDYFVLASTHLRIIDNKIQQEWTVFDEVAAYANLIKDYQRANADTGVASC